MLSSRSATNVVGRALAARSRHPTASRLVRYDLPDGIWTSFRFLSTFKYHFSRANHVKSLLEITRRAVAHFIIVFWPLCSLPFDFLDDAVPI
jgi:hypothetical protein